MTWVPRLLFLCFSQLVAFVAAVQYPSLRYAEDLSPVGRGETAPNDALFFNVSRSRVASPRSLGSQAVVTRCHSIISMEQAGRSKIVTGSTIPTTNAEDLSFVRGCCEI